LHRRIVTGRGWVTQQKFDLSYALSRLTPGTNLLAFSTAIGWLTHGWPGAIVVLLASSVPCSILAVLLTVVYESLTYHPLAMEALRGALAAAVGIVVATAWTHIRPHVKDTSKLNIAAFAVGAFLLAAVDHVSPIRILLLSGAIGAVLPQVKQK
jgi:chromate transporter